MVKSRLLHVLILTIMSTALVSCASFEIADITPMVRLPGSQGCFGVSVLSQKEKEISKEECDKILRTSMIITYEDYQKMRFVNQKNCQMAQCKQLTGAFDNLFLMLDAGAKKIVP